MTLEAVATWKIVAKDGSEPACWILLTDLPVQTLEQCQRVLAIYRRRWLVEELHKALKTGLKVEESQLGDARRLGVLIGVLSIVGTGNQDVDVGKDQGTAHPTSSAQSASFSR